jgi:Family of unknown function (DUF5343)
LVDPDALVPSDGRRSLRRLTSEEIDMAELQLPYLQAYGNITKALNKIIEAQTPERFTIDYLGTKLNLKGGSARPVIPYLKRTGFLNPDGSPTALYKRFRGTEAQRGAAAAEALKKGYARLYESNEYAHALDENDLKGLVLEVTGLEKSSSTFKAIIGSFNALKAFGRFDGTDEEPDEEEKPGDEQKPPGGELPAGLNLGYTINLHLPPTSDVAVFNAIFKSLREHLLR